MIKYLRHTRMMLVVIYLLWLTQVLPYVTNRFRLVNRQFNVNLLAQLDQTIDWNDFIQKKLQPSPIALKRRKIEPQFAVQLMRNSYNMADELDFVPMDDFQRSFFLFRQNEWENYKSYFPSLIQGDLADPNYFDFISYCQYAVISNKMKIGRREFVEKVGANGTTQIVRRSPYYENNLLLPIVHSTLVGEKLLSYMVDKYPSIIPTELLSNNTFSSSNPIQIPLVRFLDIAQSIMNIFTINSYASNIQVSSLPITPKATSQSSSSSISSSLPPSAAIIKITSERPINLWSLQVLKYRKDNPINDFEVKVLLAVAKQLGNIQLQPLYSQLESNSISHFIKFTG